MAAYPRSTSCSSPLVFGMDDSKHNTAQHEIFRRNMVRTRSRGQDGGVAVLEDCKVSRGGILSWLLLDSTSTLAMMADLGIMMKRKE